MLRIESRETVHFEAKLARGGLPRSLWEPQKELPFDFCCPLSNGKSRSPNSKRRGKRCSKRCMAGMPATERAVAYV